MSKANFGLGSVYQTSMRSATHAFNAIGNTASALDAVSRVAEARAWDSLLEASLERAEKFGLTTAVVDGTSTILSPPEQIAEAQKLLQLMRGY